MRNNKDKDKDNGDMAHVCHDAEMNGNFDLIILTALVLSDYFGMDGPVMTYLIFVTDTTDGVCGEKMVMWRNSPHDMLSSGKFLHMINVGKLCHMEKFLHMRKMGKISITK